MNPQDSTEHPAPTETRLPRRTVLKWFAAVAAATQLPEIGSGQIQVSAGILPAAKGYGMDPDLSKFYQPGDVWPLRLQPAVRATLTALADLFFPADHLGPAASEVRVPDFIDEWVSAPYLQQRQDHETIVGGLLWLEDEAPKRFSKKFVELSEEQKRAIVDDICGAAEVKQQFKNMVPFFRKFRALSASAYYGTEAGWKAIGYVGNVPLAKFDGPPAEVLAKLGIEQTVK